MRWAPAVLSLAAWSLSACAHGAGASAASDGTLVLEVGGDRPSLREALVAHGVAIEAPRALREASAEEVPAEEPPPSASASEEPAPAPPVVEEPPAPADGPRHTVVKLGRGQTLIHLAKQHLGNGNRFRELLALNGWSEEDARRLREGQAVKIPVVARDEAASRR